MVLGARREKTWAFVVLGMKVFVFQPDGCEDHVGIIEEDGMVAYIGRYGSLSQAISGSVVAVGRLQGGALHHPDSFTISQGC
jgi:hypothetical protein